MTNTQTAERTAASMPVQSRQAVHGMAGAYAVLLGAQLAVGTAAIFARYALHGTGPITVSALRLAIASIPLLWLSRRRSRQLHIAHNHEWLFAAAGIALALHFASWIASLQFTSVAVSTLLVCTTPVWTALYDVLVRKKQKPRTFWLASLAAAIGIALITTSATFTSVFSDLVLLGDVLAIIGSIALAGYLIAIATTSNRYPTVVIVGRTYSWAALALIMLMPLVQEPFPGEDWVSWGGILAMALVSQMLGHTGLNAALRWFSSSTVAFSTLLEPVFAAVLAALVFQEALTSQSLCGCAIVMTSLVVVLRCQSD